LWFLVQVGQGSSVINGKEPLYEGHQVHKGRKELDFTSFSFVTVVSCPGTARQGRCVFEKSCPLKIGRAWVARWERGLAA
jgi:hypothetical protein